MPLARRLPFALLILVLLAGCAAPATTVHTLPITAQTTVSTAQAMSTPPVIGRPTSTWQVGASPLPTTANGLGVVEPTPAALVDRRLPTTDYLPPPADGRYHSSITQPVPADVLSRSTWQAACPVPSAALAYLTLSFWGFDGRAHTGELLVNAGVAAKVTSVFGILFGERFPIEQMRVTSMDELNAAPTGDGNTTSGFNCRPAVGQTSWSAHAYGLAIDVDPFCNPYHQGGSVVPELASAYLDRSYVRPGMILPGDATVRAFATIGWTWGGSWTSPQDLMHFTATGE